MFVSRALTDCALAIAALRIHALHNGKQWIKRLLWIAGAIYFVTSGSIIVAAQVELIREWYTFPCVALDT